MIMSSKEFGRVPARVCNRISKRIETPGSKFLLFWVQIAIINSFFSFFFTPRKVNFIEKFGDSNIRVDERLLHAQIIDFSFLRVLRNPLPISSLTTRQSRCS